MCYRVGCSESGAPPGLVLVRTVPDASRRASRSLPLRLVPIESSGRGVLDRMLARDSIGFAVSVTAMVDARKYRGSMAADCRFTGSSPVPSVTANPIRPPGGPLVLWVEQGGFQSGSLALAGDSGIGRSASPASGPSGTGCRSGRSIFLDTWSPSVLQGGQSGARAMLSHCQIFVRLGI